MKNTSFLLILTLIINFFFVSCKKSENIINDDIVIYTIDINLNSLCRYKSDSTLVTGVVTDSFGTGLQTFEYRYRKGLKNGLNKLWYDNGNQKSEINYVDGVLNGLFKYYYDNVQLEERGFHKDWSRVGKYESWYRNGNKQSIVYYSAGCENGPELNPCIDSLMEWYEDGRLKSIVSYRDGQIIIDKNNLFGEWAVEETVFLEYNDFSESGLNNEQTIKNSSTTRRLTESNKAEFNYFSMVGMGSFRPKNYKGEWTLDGNQLEVYFYDNQMKTKTYSIINSSPNFMVWESVHQSNRGLIRETLRRGNQSKPFHWGKSWRR